MSNHLAYFARFLGIPDSFDFSGLTIPQEDINAAKAVFAESPSLADDLRPGTFFDNPDYLDSLPLAAKAVICSIQHFGAHPDRPALCHFNSERASELYGNTQDETCLIMAFAFGAMALRYVPPQHPGRGKSNYQMGCLYRRRWENESGPTDLDEAIRHYKIAIDLATESDSISEWVNEFVVLLSDRAVRTKQEIDRVEARIYFDRAIRLAGQPLAQAGLLSAKGHLIRLSTTGNDQESVTLLTESIACFDEAIGLCEAYQSLPSKPQIPSGIFHRNAGLAYLARFTITKQPEDGENACSLLHQALTFETVGTEEWGCCMNELGDIYTQRAQLSSEREEEEMACIIWHQVVETKPNATTARVNLAKLYLQRSEQSLDQDLTQDWLHKAVELLENAVQVLPADDANLGRVYELCCVVHYSKYEFDGETADINRAVECGRLATQDQRSDNVWNYYRLLAQTLVTRYDRLQQIEDLQDAEAAAKEGLSRCAAENYENQAQCRWILGKVTRAMYDRARNTSTLRRALEVFQKASRDISTDISSKSLVLNDLGNAHVEFFSHEALPEHLEKAIEAYKESLLGLQRVHKTDQHHDILMVNAALGSVMLRRFTHWRAVADIESTIKYYQRSLSRIDEHHPRYAIRAANLSYALTFRAQIKMNMEDLREAQRLAAVVEGPVDLGDTLKTALETSLGNGFKIAFDISGKRVDLVHAVDHYAKASSVEGASASARATAMVNAATTLTQLAGYPGQPLVVFEMGNRALEEAQQLLCEDDPLYWAVIMKQADLLYTIYDQKLGPNHGAQGLQALEKYSSLTQITDLSPGIRIYVASQAAWLCNDILEDRAKARDHILISLNLLPEAIPMHESRLEQLRFVREIGRSIPSSVAALSLSAQDSPSTVIRRLESGRAFIWDRIQDRPTQLDALEVEKSELASRFITLQQRIFQRSRPSNGIVGLDLPSVVPEDASRMQRQNDADAYRQVLQEIRAIPGFNSFLRAPDAPADIQNYAKTAPIVFINASEYRSDALVITKDKVYHLPLPSFSIDQVTAYATRFVKALNRFRKEEEQADAFANYQMILKWLWEAAAKPVLSSIDWEAYECGPCGKPRMIWVSTKWISLFPIHAAGDFEARTASEEPSSVHDIAVSSYISSLKALDFTQQNAQQIKHGQSLRGSRKAVIAAMATTPGLGPDGDLDVDPEINSIERALSPLFNVNILRQPDSRSVKASLSTATITHFACHARADPKDPSQSTIMFQDHQNRPSPFTVRTLLRINLKGCELVYLSACESGANRDLQLLDEGIHIAGGFHIAGVPHVISTLWAVSDSISAQLAGLFYENLKEEGRDDVDLATAPYALHKAVGEMMRRGVHPMLVGPFVHSGP